MPANLVDLFNIQTDGDHVLIGINLVNKILRDIMSP